MGSFTAGSGSGVQLLSPTQSAVIAEAGGGTIAVDYNVTQISGPTTVPAGVGGRVYQATTNITVTITDTSGDTIIYPPASGNLTIAAGGSATITGAPLTRTLANNPMGVACIRVPGTNTFAVGGA